MRDVTKRRKLLVGGAGAAVAGAVAVAVGATVNDVVDNSAEVVVAAGVAHLAGVHCIHYFGEGNSLLKMLSVSGLHSALEATTAAGEVTAVADTDNCSYCAVVCPLPPSLLWRVEAASQFVDGCSRIEAALQRIPESTLKGISRQQNVSPYYILVTLCVWREGFKSIRRNGRIFLEMGSKGIDEIRPELLSFGIAVEERTRSSLNRIDPTDHE